MEVNMSSEEVLQQIRLLNQNGGKLNKKWVKKNNPQLMRSALHYFPNWDSALEKSIAE
ncbi:hypothetical protein HNQ94_000590 [Salirhabdus euzebyi]|uniref:Uncharacterized protein n=1 Tax=Salirhabdus euzebyi TaxID=394506 RepID=A0A841PTL6_9BACI|nr:hypothetical protein [Salirhabdus euzebyi]MBB6452169.1 hypothetical protein [Salirhabdus euzebyi]